jgi:DegV family protein with EDD domain
MSDIAVVADSLACLPKEMVDRYGIKIVPVNIEYDGKIYRDGVDIDAGEAYKLLDRAPEYWRSSAASPIEFAELYRELAKEVRNILVINLSSKLSMFFESALNAVEMVHEEFPDLNIEVINSETVTSAQGFIVLAAARAAALGKSFKEVVEQAYRVKEQVHFIALLETMRFVYRTGRIPKVAAYLGSMLSVKPILTASGGAIHIATATRTKAAGVDKMLQMMTNHVGTTAPVHVAIMHADALQEAEQLKERIAHQYNCAELFIADFTPVMGYATGRGTLALAYHEAL